MRATAQDIACIGRARARSPTAYASDFSIADALARGRAALQVVGVKRPLGNDDDDEEDEDGRGNENAVIVLIIRA